MGKYNEMASKDEARFHDQTKAFQGNTSNTVYKAAKDPNKPKEAKSPFIFFNAEFSLKIREENPDSHMTVREVAKAVSAKWQSLTDQEKQKYIQMAEKDKIRHEEEMKTYQAPPPVMVAVKDKNAPKAAKNAFMFFNAEFSLKIRAENPDSHMTVGEVAKAVCAKWQSLTDQEKQKYIQMAEKDKIRHEEEMKNYQAPPPVMVAVKDKNAPKAA